MTRPSADLIAFVWGAAEATVFFVIPDVIVGYVAMTKPRRAPAAFAAATAGALAGSAALYAASRPFEGHIRRLFAALPGVRDSDFEAVRHGIVELGPRAMAEPAWQGNPIKLYVLESALHGGTALSVLSSVAANRVLRVGGATLAFALLGRLLRGPIRHRPRVSALAYVAAWSFGYSVYWARRSG